MYRYLVYKTIMFTIISEFDDIIWMNQEVDEALDSFWDVTHITNMNPAM